MNSILDKIIIEIDKGIKFSTLNTINHERAYPAEDIEEYELSEVEKNHSAGLMRVNHSGEVCAQALYRGQGLTADLKKTRKQMQKAAEEELDHLSWCNKRLSELNENTSILNPIWYIMSFSVGALAGLVGDKWSLGFIDETEKQVVNHLDKHKESISTRDKRSEAIIEKMREEEKAHSIEAQKAGAEELPEEIKKGMTLLAGLMTNTSYHL